MSGIVSNHYFCQKTPGLRAFQAQTGKKQLSRTFCSFLLIMLYVCDYNRTNNLYIICLNLGNPIIQCVLICSVDAGILEFYKVISKLIYFVNKSKNSNSRVIAMINVFHKEFVHVIKLTFITINNIIIFCWILIAIRDISVN